MRSVCVQQLHSTHDHFYFRFDTHNIQIQSLYGLPCFVQSILALEVASEPSNKVLEKTQLWEVFFRRVCHLGVFLYQFLHLARVIKEKRLHPWEFLDNILVQN